MNTLVDGKKSIHFVMGTSGGIGKTSISSMMAQLIGAKIIDGEFVNRALSKYKVFDNITPDHRISNTHGIDTFISEIMNTIIDHLEEGLEEAIVIDVGSSILVFLLDYFKNSDVLEILEEEYNARVIFHGITSSSDLTSSMEILDKLLNIKSQLQKESVVIWMNGYRDSFASISDKDKIIDKVSKDFENTLNKVVEIDTSSILQRELIEKHIITPKVTVQEFSDGNKGETRTLDRSNIRRYRKPYIQIMEDILSKKISLKDNLTVNEEGGIDTNSEVVANTKENNLDMIDNNNGDEEEFVYEEEENEDED